MTIHDINSNVFNKDQNKNITLIRYLRDDKKS